MNAFENFIIIMTYLSLLCRMAQPLIIDGLLTYFNKEGSGHGNIRHAYFYASCQVIFLLTSSLTTYASYMALKNCGIRMRVACGSIIFRKVPYR